MENSAAVVLVESPRSDTYWVNEEVLHAQRRGVPLLPLVIEGEPWFGVQGVQTEFVTGGAMPSDAFLARARELVGEARAAARTRSDRRGSAGAGAGGVPGPVVVPAEAWQYPGPPRGMIGRPAPVEQIVAALLSPGSGAVAVTGVYGSGGLGKTVAVRMVCARDDVRSAFPGGLLWVELGQERRGASLAATIGDLCPRLGRESPGLVGPADAGKALGALLARSYVIL